MLKSVVAVLTFPYPRHLHTMFCTMESILPRWNYFHNSHSPQCTIPQSNNRNGAGVTNDEKNTMKKLLWMDREAMEEMTNCSSTNDHPPLFVQINTTSADSMNTKTESKISFPVQPSEEYVGEFKVTPDVHMGYAITWFGLSGAGVIMTRKLLTRGR